MIRVWERLFIGGLTDAKALVEQNPEPINTVISLCERTVHAKRRDINYLHFPVENGSPVPIRTFYGAIDAIGENIRWGRVLLHSDDGTSRAPAFAAAWMDVVGYKNIDAALNEVRRVRPDISPSAIVIESLRRHLQ